MKLPAFGLVLALGAFASAGAIAVQRAPVAGEDLSGSVPRTSAAEEFFSLQLEPSAASVTELQPVDRAEGSTASNPVSAEASNPEAERESPRLEAAGARSDEAIPAEAGLPSTSVPGLPSGVTRPVSIDPDEDKAATILDQMNGARLELGLAPLLRYPELDDVALARARHLVNNAYFDHYAPDGSSAFSELALRGLLYRLAGENLARNNYPSNQTVVAAFEGLMASPGHRANILEPMFGAVGLAVVRDGNMWVYVTIFTNPR